MVSGSCACTSITKPKSVGRLPLTSRQLSPASSLRITSQCFCMNSTPGREGFIAIRCTQWPTSASGSGMYCERSPLLIGFQLLPPSSVRNAPADEIAVYIPPGVAGWRRMAGGGGSHRRGGAPRARREVGVRRRRGRVGRGGGGGEGPRPRAAARRGGGGGGGGCPST